MSAAATYDALRLVSGITAATATRSVGRSGATEQEVHALGYLACQLAHWTEPALEWGYTFHATTQAQPFATELAVALRALRGSGALQDDGLILSHTETGSGLLLRLGGHLAVREREPFLQTACDAAVLLPTPLVLRALSHEPTVAQGASVRPLLDETASHVLAEYHEALAATAGADATLFSLTELWLQYLLATSGQDAA